MFLAEGKWRTVRVTGLHVRENEMDGGFLCTPKTTPEVDAVLFRIVGDFDKSLLKDGGIGKPLSYAERDRLKSLLTKNSVPVKSGFEKVQKADINQDGQADYVFVLDEGNYGDWGPFGLVTGAETKSPKVIFETEGNHVFPEFWIIQYAKNERPVIYTRHCQPGTDACATILYEYTDHLATVSELD